MALVVLAWLKFQYPLDCQWVLIGNRRLYYTRLVKLGRQFKEVSDSERYKGVRKGIKSYQIIHFTLGRFYKHQGGDHAGNEAMKDVEWMHSSWAATKEGGDKKQLLEFLDKLIFFHFKTDCPDYPN